MKVSTPIVRAESIGIMVIPISYVSIFMFYYAIIFLIGTSFLVGLNIALLLYLRQVADRSFGCYFNSSKTKTGNINIIALRGVSGILPALFTSFACCSGGLISIVIGSTTFSTLAIYSKYIAPLTITVLAAGTVLISRKIVNQLDTGEWINDTNCNSCIINREKE